MFEVIAFAVLLVVGIVFDPCLEVGPCKVVNPCLEAGVLSQSIGVAICYIQVD